jgi:hypothetical protein
MSTYKFELLAGINLDAIPADHRLIRIVYRSDSDKAKQVGKKNSVGVVVPVITPTMIQALIAPDSTGNPLLLPSHMASWIINSICKVQDDIARTRYEAGDAMLDDSYIDIRSIDSAIKVSVNKERAAVLRISDKSIKSWFDAHATKPLAAYFADTLRIAPDSLKIGKIVEAYKNNMALLAGRSPMESSKLDNLTKALEIVIKHVSFIDDTGMVDKLLERISVLSEITDDDMLSII